jgi:glycine cleavage system regulatory protein
MTGRVYASEESVWLLNEEGDVSIRIARTHKKHREKNGVRAKTLQVADSPQIVD